MRIKRIFTQGQLSKLLLSMALGPFMLSGLSARQVFSEEIELSTLCVSYPLNSHCEGYSSPHQFQSASVIQQTLIVSLSTSGLDDEIILIDLIEEDSDQITLTAHHRVSFQDNTLLSNVLERLSGPIPIDWRSSDSTAHETQYIAFIPDACEEGAFLVVGDQLEALSNCMYIGGNILTLPSSIDMLTGFLTIGYLEGDLLRSVSFRLTEQQTNLEGEPALETLCQTYAENSRCRYLPLATNGREDDS